MTTEQDDHQSALRLLAVVRQKLAARDARFELGGEDPQDDRLVWCRLPGRPHWRVVADLGPERPGTASDREQLEELLAIFSHAALPPELAFQRARFSERRAATEASRSPASRPDPARLRLDQELENIRTKTGAFLAAVIDRETPVFWGVASASQGTHDAALPALATLLQVGDPASLQGPLQACCLSLKQLRQRLHDEPVLHRAAQLDPAAAYLARGLRQLGGSYTAVLCFTAPFSELAVDATLRQHQAVLTRLVAALRPLDPDDGGGRVVALKPPPQA